MMNDKKKTDMRDDKDGGRRYAGGQDQKYWVGKRRQCPTRRNCKGIYDAYIYRIRADDKELSCP